ncbi:hypothetical protein D3C84_692490 [compost metagenome]
MGAEEAEGEDQHADDHQRQRGEHRQGEADDHQRDGAPEHFATTEFVSQRADFCRAVDTRQVHHRKHPDERLFHVIRLGQQAIADVVEQRDERPHQHKGLEEQQRQAGIAKVHGEAVEQAARVQRAGTEVARFGEDFPEHRRRNQGQAADHQHCRVPTDEVDQYPGDQAPAHPANRVATDVQAHRQADVLRMDLFAQVGHGDRRQPAQ